MKNISVTVDKYSKALLISLLTFVLISCVSPQIQQPRQKNAYNTINSSKEANKNKLAYELSLQLIKMEKYKKAQKLLIRLSMGEHVDAKVYANLALVNFKLAHYDDAYDNVQLAMTLNPEHPQYENMAGLITIEKGDFKSAEIHYLTAIKLQSNYANAYYNLALLYDIYYQDIDTAYSYYQQYLSHITTPDITTEQWVSQLKYSLNKE